jgi:hypothetical protein
MPVRGRPGPRFFLFSFTIIVDSRMAIVVNDNHRESKRRRQMDIGAKRELAHAFNETVRIHEASYEGKYKYGLTWQQAAERGCADKDLVPLVYAMAAGGMSDFADWAAVHAGSLPFQLIV